MIRPTYRGQPAHKRVLMPPSMLFGLGRMGDAGSDDEVACNSSATNGDYADAVGYCNAAQQFYDSNGNQAEAARLQVVIDNYNAQAALLAGDYAAVQQYYQQAQADAQTALNLGPQNADDINAHLSYAQEAAQQAQQAQAQQSQPSSATYTPEGVVPDTTSDDAIATNALSWTSSIGMSSSEYASWYAQIIAALDAGILDPGGDYATSTGLCQGASAPPGQSDLQDAALATGAATTAASVGAVIAQATSVIPIIGVVGSVASLFLSLFSKLIGPPVSQLEEKTLCPAVSAANAILNQITAELTAGIISLSQATSALDQLVSAFNNEVSSLEYLQTPNTTQFMMSSLAALQTKNTNVTYPALAQQASTAAAAAQAAAKQQQQNQISQAVQAALPKASTSTTAATSSTTTSSGTTTAASTTGSAGATPATSPTASASWFSSSTDIAGIEIPNWMLLAGGGLLAWGAMAL